MRDSRRSIAVAVGVLFLGAVLEAHLHRAFARHGFCTEHGEPIHLTEAPAPLAAIGQLAIDRAPGPTRGEHDCAALRFLSQSFESGVDAPAEETGAFAAAQHPPPAVPPRTIGLLALAPKGSPPTA